MTKENDDKLSQIEALFVGFNDRDRIFVETYCRYLSKTRAAIASGSPEKHARQYGYSRYYRPLIFETIQKYLKITAITSDENIKLITRIAKTNASDYFKIVKTVETVRQKSPLKKIIADIQLQIDIEDDFLMESDNLTKLEKTQSILKIRELEVRINKYKTELRLNPNATRWESIEKEVVSKVLDLDKLTADRVPFKSIKNTKDGLHIEWYSADAAQERLAKINGSFEADNKQLRPIIQNNTGWTPEKLAKLTDEELRAMSEIEKKLNA